MNEPSALELAETLAEVRAQLDEMKLLGEELTTKHAQLKELLAPSEAALKARTEYLDRVLREQLKDAEKRLRDLAAQVSSDSTRSNQQLQALAATIVQCERQRLRRTAAWAMAGAIGMTAGGYAAGWVAATSWRPAAPTVEAVTVPAAAHPPAGAVTKPRARTTRPAS